MTNRQVAVMTRVYSPKAHEVSRRVERAVEHARQFDQLKSAGVIREACLLIPTGHDCGGTYDRLTDALIKSGLQRAVSVYHFEGHHSCEALNAGCCALRTIGMTHVGIISGKAMPYLTKDVLEQVYAKIESGARVVSVPIDGLESVIGRVQNTFAVWSLDDLHDAGWFQVTTGVEELAPLVHLFKRYGPCIGTVDLGAASMDLHQDASSLERHRHVMATKQARQLDECVRLGVSADYLEAALLP